MGKIADMLQKIEDVEVSLKESDPRQDYGGNMLGYM